MIGSAQLKTLPDRLRARVDDAPRQVWTPADFADIGGRAAVDKALQRMVTSGQLRRIQRGLYDKPSQNALTGKSTVPDYRAVIDAIARRDQVRWLIDGMTAANTLGLTNAVPAKIEVLVDARLKPVTLDNQKIVFKQAAPSRLYWAGRPGMYLVQALHWLHDVMSSDEEQAAVQSAVRRLLASHETGPALLDDLKSGFAATPIWMQDILRGHLFGAAAGDRG
ncbi:MULTISPECIES: DUF6088 family protein [Sulfitobacter]|jgi:hypothetical protein|uniref:DUF6088 family protein n=1 Tax=Sulfitobacter TaxID=60136 RepID=UPI000594E227|nr:MULTISPECIES: DUF6088 family protein [Sulfitobacter]WPZ27456.1 DUF6088 family protein [Sulfitobacter pontiacus]